MNSDLDFQMVKFSAACVALKMACKTVQSGEINIRRRYGDVKNALACSKCFCCCFLIKSANEI